MPGACRECIRVSARQASARRASERPGDKSGACRGTGPNTSSRPSLLGVGQTHDPTKMGGPRSGVRRLVIPVVMATVLSAIGIVFVLRSGAGDQPPPRVTKPAAPKPIIMGNQTDPPGVQVITGRPTMRYRTDAVAFRAGSSGRQSRRDLADVRLSGQVGGARKDQDFSQEIKLDAVPPPPTSQPRSKKKKKGRVRRVRTDEKASSVRSPSSASRESRRRELGQDRSPLPRFCG